MRRNIYKVTVLRRVLWSFYARVFKTPSTWARPSVAPSIQYHSPLCITIQVTDSSWSEKRFLSLIGHLLETHVNLTERIAETYCSTVYIRTSEATDRTPGQAEPKVHYCFYVPEAHIMYLTNSLFIISFVMGGAAWAGRLSFFWHQSGPSRAIKFLKFLYAPAPSPPTVHV